MMLRLATIVAVAAVAVGCASSGAGTGGSGGGASSIVPDGALAYVSIDTDASSAQLKEASAILAKFPIRAKLVRQIRTSMSGGGTNAGALLSAAGPRVDLAALQVNGKEGAVGFTKPSDEKAFDAELAKASRPPVHETIDGWTVFAEKQAFIDAVKSRKGSIADDPEFKAAMKSLPDDALVRAYASTAGAQAALGRASGTIGVAGQALGPAASSKWLAAAVTAKDGAFKLELHAKSRTASSGGSAAAGIADEIPTGAIVALSLTRGVGALPASAKQQAATMSKQLGFDVGALVGALDGPVIAYLRPGIPLPEVTIAAKPAHPQEAERAIGQLIERYTKQLGSPKKVRVEGVTMEKIDLGSVGIFYGVAGDTLVVTDSQNALAELKGSSGHLADDDVFKEAKAGSGLPDGQQGFLYVNVKDALPALQGIAGLASQNLPPSVEANLRPLRSLLVFGTRDGDLQSFVAYVKTG
jgi:hypothetical protein